MPPVLTVVVPVYRVEQYLRACLDSILADPAGIEVIAVDDASPDGSARILAEYPGIRVVRLPHNVGLGLARNAGLAEATGEYVWFVDSDDLLPPGSVPAVLDALRADRPDVLLVDHLRVHEDGRTEIDASSHLLRSSLRERLLGVQHTAWNRIVRREFLLRNDLRFRPGWYEDVSFSHPVLLAADRIAVLDRVCYHYRIGRPGAITATRSDRHFEAFEQYDHLQQWMAAREVDPALKIRLFTLMISHLLVVAGNEGRMHPSRRRPFFQRLARLYRQHRPAGYTPPGGTKGLRHRLVALDSYPLYALLRAGYRIAGRTERTRPVNPQVPSAPQRAQTASLI